MTSPDGVTVAIQVELGSFSHEAAVLGSFPQGTGSSSLT